MVEDRDGAEFVAAAQACMSRGDWEKALDLARRRLSLYPGDIEASYVLVRAMIRQGDGEGVLAAMSEIGGGDVRTSHLYREVADFFCDRGDWEKACYYYEKSIALLAAPQVAKILRRVADELIPASEESDSGVVEAVPKAFQTMTLVDLYVKQGHLKEALELLESMRQEDPDNDGIVERIRGVQALMGEGEFAEGKKRVLVELDRWLQNIYKAGTQK